MKQNILSLVASPSQPTPLVLSPEVVEALRTYPTQFPISAESEMPQALPRSEDEQEQNEERQVNIAQAASFSGAYEQEPDGGEQETNNYERVRTYLVLTISWSTVNKWHKRLKAEETRDRYRKYCISAIDYTFAVSSLTSIFREDTAKV